MKRIFALLIAVITVLTICSCNNNAKDNKQPQSSEYMNNQETTAVQNTVEQNKTTQDNMPEETNSVIELNNNMETIYRITGEGGSANINNVADAVSKGILPNPSLEKSILETVKKERTEVINGKTILLTYKHSNIYKSNTAKDDLKKYNNFDVYTTEDNKTICEYFSGTDTLCDYFEARSNIRDKSYNGLGAADIAYEFLKTILDTETLSNYKECCYCSLQTGTGAYMIGYIKSINGIDTEDDITIMVDSEGVFAYNAPELGRYDSFEDTLSKELLDKRIADLKSILNNIGFSKLTIGPAFITLSDDGTPYIGIYTTYNTGTLTTGEIFFISINDSK